MTTRYFKAWIASAIFLPFTVVECLRKWWHKPVQDSLSLLLDFIMTTQEKIDAIATAIDTATTGIRSDIQTLKDAIAAGQSADFTALDAKVAALAALDAENPAPPPVP